MRQRPEQGDIIRVYMGEDDEPNHVCTVVDLLSVQLRATYEVQRPDGGWVERSLFCFYADVEWDASQRTWKGRAG